MDVFSLTVTGAKELEEALDSLEPKVRKKHVRDSLKASLEPVAERARQLCPSQTVADKIAVLNAKADHRGDVAEKVGFRRSDKLIYITKSGERYHLGYVHEYGHVAPYANIPRGADASDPRYKRSHQANTKAKVVPPHPFIRPAGDELGDAAENKALELIARGVETEWKGS